MELNPTEKRIDELENRVGRFEDRFERFEDKVEASFDKVDAKFERVDARFDQLGEYVASKEDLNKLEARLDRWGQLMTGGVLAVAGTLIVKILGG